MQWQRNHQGLERKDKIVKQVSIYTDGACSGNPGPGGWGAILIYKSVQKEISGFDPATTNNRMELMGVIRALELLKEPCLVSIYSDSAYFCNAINNGWLQNWKKNDFIKADKQPVENIDLWKEILKLSARHAISVHKVKGHADNEFNNRCDRLARAEIDSKRKSS